MSFPVAFQPIVNPGDRAVVTDEVLGCLHFPINAANFWFTDDTAEIASRQEIFRCLMSSPETVQALENGLFWLDSLGELVRKSGGAAVKDNAAALYSLREMSVFTSAVEAFAAAPIPRAEALASFFATIRELVEDERYQSLKNWLDNLGDEMREIRSITIGVNLDAQLNAAEAGIVSINSKPFMAGNLLERGFRREKAEDGFTTYGVIGIKESAGFLSADRLTVDRAFYSSMNEIIHSSLKSLRRQLTTELADVMRSLLARKEEIAFLLSGVKYIEQSKKAGLNLTFPTISGETHILRLCNGNLADKIPANKIVPSDVHITDRERVFILTGPNAGGKTVFCTAVGTAQLLFQLGLPIPARSAEMRVVSRVATHFIRDIQGAVESRLADESLRLRDTLSSADADTLLLLDETFSSTSAFDALYLAEAMINWLTRTGCRALYSTHLHELTAKYGNGAADGVVCLSAKVENGRRTYEIVPNTGDDPGESLARDIAVENGLGFLFTE